MGGQPRSSPHEGKWTNGTSGPLSLAPEVRSSSLETRAGDSRCPLAPSTSPSPLPLRLTILSPLFPITFLFHFLCVIPCSSAFVDLHEHLYLALDSKSIQITRSLPHFWQNHTIPFDPFIKLTQFFLYNKKIHLPLCRNRKISFLNTHKSHSIPSTS